jgi:hypothetical protein
MTKKTHARRAPKTRPGKTRSPRKWIAQALAGSQKGSLHRTLGVAQGETIPPAKLRRAATRPGVTGKRARLALTLAQLPRQRK